MERAKLLLATVFLTLNAPPVRSQPSAAAILNCNQTRFVTNGLVSRCDMRETSIPAVGSLAVETRGSGNTSVQPWDGTDVLVRAQFLTAAESELPAAALAALVTLDIASGSLVGVGPRTDQRHDWSLNLEIFVPSQTRLSVTTLNGSITITGVAGDIRARGVNGSIFIGAAEDHWRGQTLDVQTVNGSVEVDVPNDCSAHVELSTVLGNISTNFAAPPSAPRFWEFPGFGRKLSFDVGAGGTLVRAATTLGNIQLRRMELKAVDE